MTRRTPAQSAASKKNLEKARAAKKLKGSVIRSYPAKSAEYRAIAKISSSWAPNKKTASNPIAKLKVERYKTYSNKHKRDQYISFLKGKSTKSLREANRAFIAKHSQVKKLRRKL